MDQAITRAAGATQIASPLPAATARRQWTLLLTSANHGVVGPLGSTFTHAGERFERVDVVEVPAAAGAPVDQVNLQIVRSAAPARPVGEFQGYIDGEPAVTWFDRTRMPNVGEKLYAGAAPAADGVQALTEKQIDDAWGSLPSTFTRGQGEQEWNRENRHAFARAIEREVAAQAGQVAVPEGWKIEQYNDPNYGAAIRVHGPCGFATVRKHSIDPTESVIYRYFAALSAPAVEQQAPAQAAPVPAESIECWSHNEEDFNARSLGELVDTHELQPGATVWVGEAAHPEPKSLFSTDWLIENMGEAAYDIAGEHAGEDYPNVSDEQVAELEALIVGWIAKCAPPNFWTVKNVRAYVVTAEDCGAQASTAGERQEGGEA